MAIRNSDPQDESNGERLGRARRRRRLSQQQLAERAGYSLSTVKKFEQNRRTLDRGQVILQFATALGCHPSEITGHPYAIAEDDHEGQVAASAVAAVHRALLLHGRPPQVTDAEVAAVDLGALRRRVTQMTRYRHAAALARTAEILPALLRDLQVAALVCQGDGRREAFDLLGSGYEGAMQFAYKMGHGAVSTLATERVLWSVRETEDPLRILSAHWYEAGEYIAIGEHSVAADIIDESLTTLDGIRDGGPESLSLRGAFHLKASLNSARAADATAADMALRKAQHAAEELGADRNDFELQFGPTNVGVWSVSIPVEFGRGREAVRRAENARLPADYAPERRCHLHIDLGRAHWYNGQREEALDAFLTAEEIAPQQTRMHSGVRETLRAMNRTQRPGRLTSLCMRVGVL